MNVVSDVPEILYCTLEGAENFDLQTFVNTFTSTTPPNNGNNNTAYGLCLLIFVV